MLGLTSDGKNELFAMFDASVTLQSPYKLLVLSEVLENGEKISQFKEIIKDLLQSLTENQMLLLPYQYKNIVHTVVNIDQTLQRLKNQEGNDRALIEDLS